LGGCVVSKRLSIGFIGAGILGKGLALGLAGAGYRVTAAASRSYESAQELASLVEGCRAEAEPQAVASSCDLVFITTPDDVITEVAASLMWSPGQGVAHCSGAGTLDKLMPATRQGARCGSIHPLQTFAGVTTGRQSIERMKGITFAIEAHGWLLETLEGMAKDLGGRSIRIKPEDRVLYHTSAVMACGYLAALVDSAAGLWERMGLTKSDGMRALEPIARATLENLVKLGTQKAVTGPIVRGDVETVRRHMEALSERAPGLSTLYLALAEASLPLAEGRVGGAKAREVEAALSEYMAKDGVKGD